MTEKTTNSETTTPLTEEELKAKIDKISEYDAKIESVMGDMTQYARRAARATILEGNGKELDALDFALDIGLLMASICSLKEDEEFYSTFKSQHHIVQLQVDPKTILASKKGKTIGEFKAAHPEFTKWLEDNGWTYSVENDKTQKEGYLNE